MLWSWSIGWARRTTTLIDGEHVVYYDHTNKTDLLDKLTHALNRPHWARKVGVKGYAHVLVTTVSCSA